MYKIINKTSIQIDGIIIPHYDVVAIAHTRDDAEEYLKEALISGLYINLVLWSEYNGTY